MTSEVKTFTKTQELIRWFVNVGVSYESNPKEVTEALLNVAKSHRAVASHPAPAVFFEDFGASSLDFQLAVWINPVDIKPVSSQLRYLIWDELAERNIEIPFPQRDLHLRSGWPLMMENPSSDGS